MSAAQYKLEVMVCKDGRDYTVTCSCNGFSGQGKDMYIEEAFKESYKECMARLAVTWVWQRSKELT